MDQDLVGSREAADGQLGERWVGTPRAQRWAWWCRDKPGSSGVSPTTPFVLSGWWRYTDGEGNSSSTSWGGPWSDFYDETVTDHGFYAGAYYVLDYGGGREEYFAHLGDAFSEYASYDSGFFAFAYSNEQRVGAKAKLATAASSKCSQRRPRRFAMVPPTILAPRRSVHRRMITAISSCGPLRRGHPRSFAVGGC